MEVRIGKKQRPQSCDYSLVPCPRRDKGDMIYRVYFIIAFGVNGRARCAAIERLLRQSFGGCAVGAGAARQDHRDGSLLACTAVAGDAPVSLGIFHNVGLLLRPLCRLLFFRRHRRFLLLVPLIFQFFGHRIGSMSLRGSVAKTSLSRV